MSTPAASSNSSGSRQYPLALLRDAGVDMASPDPVESALSTYGEYLETFADLQ